MAQDGAPPLAALFMVVFDQKVGYTIVWQRTLPALELGGVEYKSLPSGLHSVPEDLVYFVHDDKYAGVSAFVQAEADEAHRNANLVAVGALVPLSDGSLGQSWQHVRGLRALARQLVQNLGETESLELFWEQHKLDGSCDAPTAGAKRRQVLSEGAASSESEDETAILDDPALAMTALLDTFGPLLFPLYRAALLRKQILLLGSPPVQQTCHFVHLLSTLSRIPQSLHKLLPPDLQPMFQLPPLFSVGVHDIPFLAARKGTVPWVACTTDDILGEKHTLYDVLVDLRPLESGSCPRWPKLRAADGKVFKSSQRDLRRYHVLRAELRRLQHGNAETEHDEPQVEDEDEQQPLLRNTASISTPSDSMDDFTEVVEPVSWQALAYDSFMWWAPASEQDASEREESASDLALLANLPGRDDTFSQPEAPSYSRLRDAQGTTTLLPACFERLTHLTLATLANIVQDADDDAQRGVEEGVVLVSFDDVRSMGLDPWNEDDEEFVREAMKLWFRKEALVGRDGLRVCGVRIC